MENSKATFFRFDNDSSYARLKEIFIKANNIFIKKDALLIIDNVSERTLCGALKSHIEEELAKNNINGYYADVEYNRNGGRIKTIVDDELQVINVQCDLIVHSRREKIEKDNLIAIEMKKKYRIANDYQKDRTRLCALTKSSYNNDVWSFDGKTFSEHVCRYILGVFYEIDRGHGQIRLEFYRNGNLESTKIINFRRDF